jgi:hypothetical protein
MYLPGLPPAAWSGDFFELVAALKEDFDARWEAHKAYLKQRKVRQTVPFDMEQMTHSAQHSNSHLYRLV